MKSAEEIVDIYYNRSQNHSGVKSRMRTIRDHYNGDVVVPLPEIDTTESAAVANLLAQGLDQTAMRVSSVLPDIVCPASDEASKRALDHAQIRRKAMFGWWQNSTMDLHLAKRARHLIGYSQSITQVRFDPKKGVPTWHTRDPLTSFPSNLRGVEDVSPADCVFGYERSYGWISNLYPEAALRFAGGTKDVQLERDQAIEMIEYVDHEETVLIAVRSPQSHGFHSNDSGPVIAELERTPNLIGRCPVIVSNRISLGDSRGQFDGILGMYQQQAKLMALEVLAVQKGIFPDTWLVGNAGEQPKIINTANGLTGEVGIIRGGSLRDMQLQPGFMTNPAIDRLERAQRLTAGIPAEFGGESASNIRTGRRGDAVLSAVVDFTVQETQKTLARALEEENRVAIAQSKAYAGDQPKSFYVSIGKVQGKVDYTPNKHFTTDDNVVSYSQAGADINNLVIAGGQRLAMGTMSKEAFMRIDPLVEDVEKERDAVVAEQLEQSLLSGLQQQAIQGALPPSDLARIMELVKHDHLDLADAVGKVQREAQERQATQAEATSPEAQPGIAQPGAGAEAAGGPPAAPASLGELLGAL
tara:strand:+ start:2330 stop:4081 length:1752 start_codon:yes stop_codon:yes gene_type:complete